MKPHFCIREGKERDCKGIQSKKDVEDLKKRLKVKAYQQLKAGSRDLDIKLGIESSN